MLSATDCKKGVKLLYKDEPFVVVNYEHVKPGKGGALVRLKLKNLITNLIHDATFRSEVKFDQPNLEYRKMQYLYEEGGKYSFMDQEDYEQIDLNKDSLDEVLDYLKEQEVYTMLYWNDRPIAVTPPLHMTFEVQETPPGVKGDTAQGAGNKPATLETGLVVQVPLFVNSGDWIKVDTRDGKYIERVQK
jgi:elongation factor P